MISTVWLMQPDEKNKLLNEILTPVEIVDIRLACVKMFVDTASKLDMKDELRITQKAKLAWDFVTETIVKDRKELPKGSKSS